MWRAGDCSRVRFDAWTAALGVALGALAVVVLLLHALLISLLRSASAVIPPNVRLLLLHCSYGVLIATASAAPTLLVTALRTLGAAESAAYCAPLAVPFAVGAIVQVCALSFVAVERWLAYRYSWYMDDQQSSVGVRALVVCCWLAAVVSVVAIPLSHLARDMERSCVCHAIVTTSPRELSIVAGIYTSTSLLAVLVVAYVRWASRRRYHQFGINQSVSAALSDRFQIWTCMQTTKTLMPSVILQALAVPPQLLLWLYLQRQMTWTNEMSSYNLLLLSRLPLGIFNVFHPLLCISGSKHLLRLLQIDRPRVAALLYRLRCLSARAPAYGATVVRSRGRSMHAPAVPVVAYQVRPEYAQSIVLRIWQRELRIVYGRRQPPPAPHHDAAAPSTSTDLAPHQHHRHHRH